MPFDYDFSDKLKDLIPKLRRKAPQRAEMLYKKVKQIINSDETTIEHYKNLRHGLSDRKRVRVDKSFVLAFKFDRKRKFIMFLDFDHPDNIYRK